MRVLVFEDNLMWSSRLLQSLRGLGHEPQLLREIPSESLGAQAAIVNLALRKPTPEELIPALRALGIIVIAHAGHKETALREFGTSLGVELLVTNSELTFKLPELLGLVAAKS